MCHTNSFRSLNLYVVSAFYFCESLNSWFKDAYEMVLLTSKCNPQLTLPFWLNSCFHCHHYQYHCRCFTVSKKHILGLQNHRWNNGAVLCGKNAASTKNWFDILLHGCTDDAVVKNLPANAGDIGDMDLIPESGRSRRGGNDNLLQYSCLKNSMDWGAWWAIVHAKSQTWLSTHCICYMGLHSMTPRRNTALDLGLQPHSH